MKENKLRSYEFGQIAEIYACIFLIFKGYKILKKNYKNCLGEIDIIAKKGKTFVAVEVKARKAKAAFDEIVTHRQKNRIKNSFHFFLSNNLNGVDFAARIDLIVIFPWRKPVHLQGFLA